jgi:predicted fused transcriptional regulator/phosphomethylpyrimidine kinase/predicted transcriptional regulator
MHTFCEIVTEDLLPPIRALLAHRLREKGYSQTQISNFLGKTQPLISYYLSNSTEYWASKLKSFGLEQEVIESCVETLSRDIISEPKAAIKTFNLILKDLLKNGKICQIHKQKIPSLKDCTVCVEVFSQPTLSREKELLLKKLEKAIKDIEDSPYFVSIMPEVYVNIAASLENCRSFEDIATIPGRIVRVKNRAKALMPPEFGIISHLTKLLLEIKKISPATNVVINIKYDKKLAHIVSNSNISFFKTEHDVIYNEDDVINCIRKAVTKIGKVPQVIFDEGGFGLEPITYVFGTSIDETVKLVLDLAKKYTVS